MRALALSCTLAALCHAEEAKMVKIAGVVTESEVRDVSKRAGVKNPRLYLTVAVDKTDPPSLQGQLPARVQFIGAGPEASRAPTLGARVEVSTHYDAAHPVDRYDIYALTP